MEPQNAMPATNEPSRAIALVGAPLLAFLLIGGAYLTLRGGPEPRAHLGGMEEQEAFESHQPDGDYTKWDKPLVALVVTGQMHGFVDKCGCSDPQYGGLPRRYNFIQSLKAKGWDVVGIDLGEMISLKGIREQNLLKYELSVKALAEMNYKVMGIGRDEMLAPLGDALAHVGDDKKLPRPISTTLTQAAPGQLLNKNFNLRQSEIIETKPRIGVLNLIGPDLRDQILKKDPTTKFLNNSDELPKALAAFAKAGVEIGMVLHHEYPELDEKEYPLNHFKRFQKVDEIREKQAQMLAEFWAGARKKNARIPPVQLMLLLTEDPEPSAVMKAVTPTTNVVEIGHKGKYVGLVGIYRAKNGYRIQYAQVLMEPKWETPEKDKKTHPILAWMEEYNDVLKKRDILALAPRTPHYNQIDPQKPGLKATYVGSKSCKNCHKEAFTVWEKSHHHKATDTLEMAKFPSGRQYDPECMKCHTTGFEHPSGYGDPKVGLAALQAHNNKLRGVGCESCHGPASAHVNNTDDLKIRALLNPYGPREEERVLAKVANKDPKQAARFRQLNDTRMEHLNRFCIQCHDLENDVHWNDSGVGVHKRFQDIIHRTPPGNNNGGGNGPAPKNDPAAKTTEPPPIVIEVEDPKKK